MTVAEQERYIVDNYLEIPVTHLARDLGRSPTFVKRVLRDYNLVIPKEIRNARRQIGSTFVKGSIPFNKGRKIEEWMSPEGLKNFKKTLQQWKGKTAHNAGYDFQVVLRNDSRYGQMYWIRLGPENWMKLHRYLWTQLNGTIPKGHLVQFKDGDQLNVDIDNLYLTTRKRQCRVNQNGGRKLPYDIQKSIDLIYQLKSKIDEKI